MQDHLQAGLEQLQCGGLDAVVQGQAADDHAGHALGVQVLDHAGGQFVVQVVVTGAVGVQVGFNTFPDEVVIVIGRRQRVQQGEALGARYAMAHPGHIGMGQAGGLQHLAVLRHHPGRMRGVGILAADAMAGQAGHVVELGTDLVAAGHRQFVGAQWREALLGVDIE